MNKSMPAPPVSVTAAELPDRSTRRPRFSALPSIVTAALTTDEVSIVIRNKFAASPPIACDAMAPSVRSVTPLASLMPSMPSTRRKSVSANVMPPENASISLPVPPVMRWKFASGTVSVSSPSPPRSTSAPPLPRSVSSPRPPTMTLAIAVAGERLAGGVAEVGDGIGRAADRRRAEQHVAVAGIGRLLAGPSAPARPNDQVVEAVAVDVAGRGDRVAGEVVRLLAVDDEAAGAGGDVGEIDRGAKAARLAEHHIAVAGKVGAPLRGAVGDDWPR